MKKIVLVLVLCLSFVLGGCKTTELNLKKESKPQSHVRWGMTSEQGDQVRARDPGGS